MNFTLDDVVDQPVPLIGLLTSSLNELATDADIPAGMKERASQVSSTLRLLAQALYIVAPDHNVTREVSAIVLRSHGATPVVADRLAGQLSATFAQVVRAERDPRRRPYDRTITQARRAARHLHAANFGALIAFSQPSTDLDRWVPHFADHLTDIKLWRPVHLLVLTGDLPNALRALADHDLWLMFITGTSPRPSPDMVRRGRYLAENLEGTPASKHAQAILADAYLHAGDPLAAYVTGQHTTTWGETIASVASRQISAT